MHYSHITFALTLVGPITSATPITLDASTFAASFPIRQLSVPGTGMRPNSTLPSHAFRALAPRQEFPANFLLCQFVNCQGCSSFPIQGEVEDTCIAPEFEYVSAAIAQPSNQGLPLIFDVGTTGCQMIATIPQVNVCFNLNGNSSPFYSFAIVAPPPNN
ncbi:uncharacterized protein TRAVEDRAFT_47947 [Trametes versicolor FP-101664 SS1]|uniref:uncharacterized protein n=1 Tax=Trametes versicolor (strain FP-101664) TaxID=717944 RepID=UPI0004623312|nr:uncharacterized protein TRAVEDRAFT_47947 [Trametes versicolor FP-101664 SS1]EIW58808.1 hypothetical protein TRAVEDRAFT_47947 [Trametes versicolor FP-101664 SS1]